MPSKNVSNKHVLITFIKNPFITGYLTSKKDIINQNK